ncbi:MAG: hypothetical protein HDT46_03475 [Ruminococcaceae bacterium]|nr:hypothetical protein [Oscillospiraceae bacterium]
MKKRVVSFLVCAFFAVFAAGSVYAHSGDVFKGKYLTDIQKSMKIRVTQSAQTSFFNSYVYNGALDWNDISSNVRVSVIMEMPGMPSITDSVNVYDDEGDFKNSKMGEAYHFNRNGVAVGSNDDWSYSTIKMNTDSTAYDELPASQRKDGARMCFIHEVGHVLKLAHPDDGGSAIGHNYANLLPYAVMNTGLPVKRENGKYDQVAWTVADHDKLCLWEKWGN